MPAIIALIILVMFTFTLVRLRGANHTIEEILRESQETNYLTIARLEEHLFDGTSYHNGLPRDNDKPCQCNTICHPERFYIETVQPMWLPMGEVTAQYYDEWRDREGE